MSTRGCQESKQSKQSIDVRHDKNCDQTDMMFSRFDDVFEHVTRDGLLLEFAGEYRRNNEIVSQAIKQNPAALVYAHPDLWTTDLVHFVCANTEHAGVVLGLSDASCKNNKKIVMAAVENDVIAVQHASSRLRSDKQVILKALACLAKPESLTNSSRKQQQQRYSILRFAGPALRDDDEVVMNAVKLDGLHLHYASCRLKDSMSVVLAAVQKNGINLMCVSLRLRNCMDVVATAVKQNPEASNFVPKHLQQRLDQMFPNLKLVCRGRLCSCVYSDAI